MAKYYVGAFRKFGTDHDEHYVYTDAHDIGLPPFNTEQDPMVSIATDSNGRPYGPYAEFEQAAQTAKYLLATRDAT